MTMSIDELCPRFADGSPNYFDAYYNDIATGVPPQEIITVDAEWQANLPGLAAKLGVRYAYHILLTYNGISDPLNDVKPGVRLRIPERNALMAYLQRRESAVSGSNYLSPSAVTIL